MKQERNQQNPDPQRDRLSSGKSDLEQNTSGSGNESADSRTSRGGTTDMGTNGLTTRRGDSGISTKRNVTGSDYDGQVSGS
jgi:hypothetical protein